MEKIILGCNQWLEKMRETYMPAKRPDLAAVQAHIRSDLYRALSRDNISAAVQKFAYDWNLHTGNANITTITLLDVQLAETSSAPSECSDALLWVGTWTKNPKGFHCFASIWVKMDRDFGCPRAVHLGGSASQVTLWDIVEKALRLQEQQGGQVTDRWLNAPVEWRSAHPICPRCGSSLIYLSDFGRLVCDDCNWTSKDKDFCRPQELSEGDCFGRERRRILKVQKAEDELRECLAVLGRDVARLEQVSIGDVRKGESVAKFGRQLRELNSRIEKMEAGLTKQCPPRRS